MIKRLVFWAFYFFALVAICEAGLAGFFYISNSQLVYTRNVSAGDVPAALQLPGAVFQPYAGYTLRQGRGGPYLEEGDWIATNFGYQAMVRKSADTCCDYPYKAKPNEYLVGVFGGSVGTGFALQAQADGSLAKELERVPGISGKKVIVLNFALPGFRQPQQLTSLAYFLSIGQKFDLILNIDGFNEVVTSWKNWSDGAEPSFPADSLWGAWGRQLEQQNVPVAQRGFHLANYHALAVRASKDSEDICVTAICYYRHKVTGLYHAWRVGAERASLPEKSEQRSIFPTKIISAFPENFNVFTYTAELWRRSSVGMASLAKSNNAQYVHLLQPNQWFTEAGPYSPIAGDHIYKWVIDPVNQGYPELRSKIPALELANIPFFDYSLIFKGVPERNVYYDDCCHYKKEGYLMIYKALANDLSLIIPEQEHRNQ